MNHLSKSLFQFFILFFTLQLAGCKSGEDTIAPTPTITSLSILEGEVGTNVTITGQNLGTAPSSVKVFFNTTEAEINALTDTQISTTVPSGATTGIIKLQVNGREATGPSFTVLAPISISVEDFSIVIDENPNADIQLGGVVATTNRGSMSYSIISQSVDGALTINETNGQLAIADFSSFDFEVNPSITATYKVANSTIEVTANITVTLTDLAEAPTNGLIASYTFNSGDATDDTDNNYDAAVVTATLTSDRFGNSNRAYAFNGSQSIEMDEYVAFDLPTISISLWFKTNTSVGVQRLIFLGSTSDLRQNFSLVYNVVPEKVDFRYEPTNPLPGGTQAVSTTSVNDNEWHHAVGVRDGVNKTLKIYLDGVLESTVSYTNDPVTANTGLLLGRTIPGFSQYLTGSLDDVRIYDRILTGDEINDLLFLEDEIN